MKKSIKKLMTSLIVIFLFAFQQVNAGTFTVTNTNDAGAGSLRQAVADANANAGADVILFSISGTINLTSGQILITGELTITGPGQASLTINQTTDNRVFVTGSGAVIFLLQHLTINFSGPGTTPYSGGGGAILAGGAGASTTLIDVAITNFSKQIGNGGAISASSSLNNHSLTITDCIFTGNKCGGAGGAVSFNSQGGTATITGCTFTNNRTGIVGANTGGDGGAVSTTGGGSGGTYLIEKNTFINNHAESVTAHAGAVMNTNGMLTLRFNRFIGNTCANVAFPPLANIIGQAGGAAVHTTIADNNWWGVNTGPGPNDATALAAGAVMTLTKWLQLKSTASPNPICNTSEGLGNTSTVTSSFLSNSADEAISLSNLSVLIGLPVSWSATLGSLSGQQSAIQPSGTATALFTSDGTGGTATVNAVVDNLTATETSPSRANITVNILPTVTAPTNTIACVGSTITFTSTITGAPAPTILWRIGTTALIDGLQASGSIISGAGTATLTISNAQMGDASANYNVQASNPCGIVTSADAALALNIPSVAPTSISGITVICNPASTTLTAELGVLGTGANYQWGTGSVIGTSPLVGQTASTITVSPTSTTTYWVRIENTAFPCTSNTGGITQVVTVNQPSTAPSGATGNTTICNGDNTTLTVDGGTKGTGAITEWFTGSCGGTSAGIGDVINVSPTTSTTYYVRYSGTCNTTTCATVTVNITSNNSVSLTSATGSDAQSTCVNTSITNINYATTGASGANFSGLPPGVTGLWSGNVVTISGTPSGPAPVTYNYTVTLTGGCGNVTANGTITVNPVVIVSAPMITQPTCAAPAGSIIINATGMGTLEYSINGGTNWFTSNSFSPGAGVYTIVARSQSYPACVMTYSGNPVVLIAASGCTVPPTITCPSNIITTTDAGQCSKTVSFSATSTGIPSPSIVYKIGTTIITSPYTFPVGTTTVNGTASNVAGLANCSFTVTVNDNQPPVITTIAHPILLLWPPNHKYQTVTVAQFVTSLTDNCGSIPAGNVFINKVTSDEAEDAPGDGDGNTMQDIMIAPDCKSVNLRSERMGGGNGRVYTIYFSVSDGKGNTATATARAIVVPNQSGVTAVDNGPVYTVNSSCYTGSSITQAKPGASLSPNVKSLESFVTVQNLPNPFTSFTTIRYQLPVNAQVSLAVFNSLGQRVVQLVNSRMSAGQHTARFEALNRTAGIYQYILKTTGADGKPVELSGKMVMVK